MKSENGSIFNHCGADRGTSFNTSATEFLELADEESKQKFSRGGTITSTVNLEELANTLNERMVNRVGGNNQRLAIMLGMLTKDRKHPIAANIPSEDRSQFSQERYKFLLEAPFEISNKCCDLMKKNPAHDYTKKTGRYFITAQMASESRLRTQKWLQNGCNGFDLTNPISNHMSFWTEQDILLYISEYLVPPLEKAWKDISNTHGSKRKKARKYLKRSGYRKTAICSVYGDVVEDYGKDIEGQINLSDYGIGEKKKCYKCTGCSRTGCVGCCYGVHLEKGENRFDMLSKTHPHLFDFLMRGGAFDENGLWKPKNGMGYWFILQWLNIHGGFNIHIENYEYYKEKYGNEETKKYLHSEE